ncbi:hypothetical protein KY285_023765 [Solanum tuberosum]|nr:hypothetical protein KY289_024096 [Solanum tuberosum]KAH0675964.1 hypothetical protein KY285_023765 [Solanum tuberosum]
MDEYYNGDSFGKVKERFKDRSKKTKERTKQMLSKQAVKIAQRAEEHEPFINKVTHLLGVLGFGAFCFILGASQFKKWHYYLLDFCYYANTIFIIMLLGFPTNERFFMVCFSFAEGPLAWALIVWRCSLVFSSVDKTVSVFIHLLPGSLGEHPFPLYNYEEGSNPVGSILFYEVFPSPFSMVGFLHNTVVGSCVFWSYASRMDSRKSIMALCRKPIRLLRDPEVMTSYRELSKKAKKANNMWWRLSGLLGDQNRLLMFILLQAIFTVATTALTVPIFLSYKLHVVYQILEVSASVWNGGNFLLEVMPRQVILKEKKKSETRDVTEQQHENPLQENSMETPQ